MPTFIRLMNSKISREQKMALLISLFSSDSSIFPPFIIQYNGIRNMKFWITKSISEKDFSSQNLLLRILQKLPVSAEGIILSGISEVLKIMTRSENKDIADQSVHLLKTYKQMISENENSKDDNSSNKKRGYEDTLESSSDTLESISKRKKESESSSDEIIDVPKPKKPKKSVRWAPDDELEQIKIFEKEKSVTGIDFRTTLANELINEREQRYIKRRKEIEEWKLKKDNMLETIKWMTPLEIDFEGKINNSLKLKQQKIETSEQKAQIEREEGTLMAIYLSELDIPFSPAEPDKKNSLPTYDDMSILMIPPERIQQPIPIPNLQQPLLNLGQFLPGYNSQPNLLNTQQMYLQNPMNNQQKGFNLPKIPPNNPNPLFMQPFFNQMNQPNTIPMGVQGNINFKNPRQPLGMIPTENLNQEVTRYGDYNIIKTMYNINQLKSPNDLKKFECRFFPKGRCEYGSSCKYLHMEPIRGTR